MTGMTQEQPANAADPARAGDPAGLARLVTLLILPTAGMYATFQGLQQILIPAQMEALDPVNKIANLGLLTTLSAISAVIALPAGGAVSDRTRGRWGRRTPWLVATSLVSAILMIIMGRAEALLPFALVYMLLWFVMNFYQGALTAVLPDRVPPERRGIASAMIGFSVPLGIMFGVNIAARMASFTSYAVIAAMLLVLTAAFVFLAPEPPYRERSAYSKLPSAPKSSVGTRVHAFFGSFGSRDFTFAFLSRALLFVAYFSASGYLFYFMQDGVGAAKLPGGDVKLAVSKLSTVNMIAWIVAILISGWLADRWKRHKMFVGISAVGLSLTFFIPILVPTWHGMLIYSTLNGLFFGTYMAIDLALMSFVLPQEENAGRDMGLLAVATAAPQLVSPTIAGGLILLSGYDALYFFAVVTAMFAGVCAFFIRGVR